MSHWIWIALTAGCGQMYQAPGAPAPMPPPAVQPAVAAGPSADLPPAGDPAPEAPPDDPDVAARASEDPNAAARPARPTRPRSARAPSGGEGGAWIEAHNHVRAKHCAAPLTWSAKLAQVAQRWAVAIRDKGCAFGHSNGSFGENLAAGTTGTLDPAAVVAMWYDEVAQYRFPNGGFSMKTGHFTQVVWRRTSQVGCGTSQCNGMDIWVCEYDPAGNWEGQYRDNVLPVGCR